MKTLDLSKSVAELVRQYPELKEVMAGIGFHEILNPMALKMMGSIMTIPRGAVVKGIPIEKIRADLEEAGFTVVGGEQEERQVRLREYVGRLTAGEDLESVRADFVKHFEHVAAEEIADAEQSLIKGGVPVKDVQRLCDVHSALFHGKMGSGKKVVDTHEQAAEALKNMEGKDLPEGHPLNLLKRENEAMCAHLDKLQEEMDGAGDAQAILSLVRALNGVRSHYAKKEELLMPRLYDYGVTGPSQVMWGVDDEIKREVGVITKSLTENTENYPLFKGRLTQVMQRIREMVFKEEKILFPLTMRYFTEADWLEVYRDIFEIGVAFMEIGDLPRWERAEAWIRTQYIPPAILEGKVRMDTGELTVRQLQGILKLLDVDITFIDKDDIVRYFINEGHVFTRPFSCIGREVYNCHPPEIIPVVRQMILDFKAKKRDRMEVWRRIMGRPIGVRYLAVYDDAGEYVGTVEFVQDFQKALDKFGRKQ